MSLNHFFSEPQVNPQKVASLARACAFDLGRQTQGMGRAHRLPFCCNRLARSVGDEVLHGISADYREAGVRPDLKYA